MRRILLVEDHADNRQIVPDLLEGEDFELVEATSGEDGVRMVAIASPDLILIDMQLPGIDGYEATRRIRANPEFARIPIIAVTSYALSGDEAKAQAAGCDDYVTKPFSPVALLEKIRGYLPEPAA